MMGMGPPPRFEYDRVEKPKGLRDLPRYLRELLGGFFGRLSYIFGLVWRTGHWILIVMSLIALLTGLLPVIGSVISRNILNALQKVIEARGTGNLEFFSSSVFLLIIFFFIHRILSRLLTSINGSVTRIAGEKVVRTVRLQIMDKAKELDLASFDMPGFYEKLENANREAGNRPISILSSTFTIISRILELVSYVAVLASAPDMWWGVIVIIAVSIPSAIINFIYRRKNFKYMRNRSKERRQMNYYANKMVDKDVVKEIRMYDLSDTFIDRFKNVFNVYYRGLRRLILQESFWHIAIIIVSALTNMAFYLLIAMKVFYGEIMIGDYNLYTGSVVSIATCVTSLISTSATVYEGTLFIDNLISFTREKQTIVPTKENPEHVAKNSPHTLVFEHVYFKYPGSDRYVLEDINLTFRPGETVVLVGLNGAGKTTLIKLLTRLYDPTEGRILLDGRDLREYDVSELYSIFGIIFQDFGKYAFTVGENIAFGDIHKPYNEQEIRDAAVQSNVDGYVNTLPDGYDTPLMRIFEQNGTELSGGQWQKIAVARAFYADSDILILDEPTAALDAIAEQEIFNQFDRLRADKTTIFVSHRLSSATAASLIVVLEYGKVIETGTHRQLMEQKGRYFELFSTQAKRYIENQE